MVLLQVKETAEQIVHTTEMIDNLTAKGILILVVIVSLFGIWKIVKYFNKYIKDLKEEHKQEIKELKKDHKEDISIIRSDFSKMDELHRAAISDKEKRSIEQVDEFMKHVKEFAMLSTRMEEKNLLVQEKMEENFTTLEKSLDSTFGGYLKDVVRNTKQIAEKVKL